MAASEKLTPTQLASLPDSSARKHGALNPLADFHKCASMHPQRNMPVDIIDKPNGEADVSVVSWNMLSDTYYGTWPDEEQDYTQNDRTEKIKEWIERLIPTTILVFQEVDFAVHANWLNAFMDQLGYDTCMQKATKGVPCGICVCWDRAICSLDDYKSFSRTLACKFLLVDDAQTFCVVGAHLESNKSACKTRASQLNSPLAWVAKSKLPVIIAGDFNSGADSMLHHALRSSGWHGYEFSSAYEHPNAVHTLAASFATFAVKGRRCRIDHILYSHDGFNITDVYDLLTEDERYSSFGSRLMDIKRKLPNKVCPSDHLPIGAAFEFNTRTLPGSPPKIVELTTQQKHDLVQYHDANHITMRIHSKPTPIQLAELKRKKQEYTNWLESLDGPSRKFVYAHHNKK